MKPFLSLILTFWSEAASASCRLALILALDVSGSVDETEYVLQLNGVATALENPDVKAALFAMPGTPVNLAIFEWSSATYQRQILDWSAIDTSEDLTAVTQRLRSWKRRPAPEATALGAAMDYAGRALRRAPFCWKKTLDVSADGKNNDWPLPSRVKDRGELNGVTVNALVIGREVLFSGDDTLGGVAELSAYFSAKIIQGPQAFVEVALGYEDYANAMTRKLLRELSTPAIGHLKPNPRSIDIADLIAPKPFHPVQ
jgi:hypothetical protein